MELFRVAEHSGSRIGTREEGRKVRLQIEAKIKELPYGDKLILDLQGIELMGYSFADEAIVITFQRLISNEYGDKYILIKCPNKDILESLDLFIKNRNLTAIVLENGGWFSIGIKKDYLLDTLKLIIERREISTPELAKILKSTVNNCNNRVAELARMKLIKRQKSNNPVGGIFYLNKSIV